MDVEILNKQKAAPPLVKYHSQANISFTNVPSQDTSGCAQELKQKHDFFNRFFFLSWKKLFRQKSGVLGVMHNLTKRNRLVSKHGRINAYTRDDGQQNHRFLKDFFTSTIDLSWSVIFPGFAASFFLSIQLSHRELSLSRRESCNSRLIYDEKQVNLESSRITFLRISREIHVSRHSSPKFEKCNSRIKPPFSHSRLIWEM